MPNILIVEDDAATAWALEQSLCDEGYAVTVADTAEKALAHLKRHAFELVITDLRLPRMGGLEFVKRIQARKQPSSVIVVTAYGSEATLRQLADQGVHASFPKPFQMDRLRKSVESALRVRAA
ncbi:MAG: response regulator [Candidatus Eisenbacteria bacterium]